MSLVLHAENWPQFRGPNNQGHSSESRVPIEWNRDRQTVWRVEIPGESWSSPIVWGSRVFVTTATEEGASGRLICVDQGTGKILWNKELVRQKTRRKEDRNSYATPTPATDGERVYTCFGNGSFVAVDFNGEKVWENHDYPFYSQHGLGTSPILYKGMLIMARDGSSEGEDKKLGWQTPWDQSYLVALDASTGRQLWKTMRGWSRISHGTPAIWTDANPPQVVSEGGDVVQGFSLSSGALIWTSEVAGEGKVPSTLLGNGLVFTSGGWGGRESIKAFQLGGTGTLAESNLVWEQKRGVPKIPSMLLLGPHLFAVSDAGIITCLDAASGAVVWQERIGGNFSSSPLAAAGHIYVTSNEGETIVFKAGPKFELLARNPLGETVQASPALADGSLYLRTEKALYRIADSK